MLEVKSLHVSLGSRSVLADVSLSVKAGEVFALIGPNGAGKTTLMRAISGVIPLQSGRVLAGGKDLSIQPAARRASYLAVVPQARHLPAGFTVWQTVLLGRTPHLGWLGKASHSDLARTEWALFRTQLLSLKDRHVETLSGGEQQRVLLARALAQHTPVLLLDEPTTFLDLHHQSVLLNLVCELAREEKLAVLMALHDLNLAALYADHVALLVSGRIRNSGRPREVLTSPILAGAYEIPVRVIAHPDYGTPLVLPDGIEGQHH